MSAKETKERTPKPVKFYQKAIFPWMIIAFVATLSAGVVIGWTLRSNDYGRVQAEATAIVSKTQQ